MASWFSVDRLKDLTDQVTAQVSNAAANLPANISDIKVDGDLLQKLTLTSPELREEHDRIDREERRKEEVRDALSHMLPWETRDPERDILVEECRDAILKLSSVEDVFLGPYEMPRATVKVRREPKKRASEEGGDDDDDVERKGGGGNDGDDDEDSAGEDRSIRSQRHSKPSEESLEKLRNLEPLPPLLQEFDLDSHVGLIDKLLKEDPKLVAMQSRLSGGGDHERIFWRNYFFHCAWCRYEAGLSIDEIWSDQPLSAIVGAGGQDANSASGGGGDQDALHHHDGEEGEETITFENEHAEASPEDKAFPADPTTDTDAPFGRSGGGGGDQAASASGGAGAADGAKAGAPSSSGAGAANANEAETTRSDSASSPDFEMVGAGGQSEDDDGDDGLSGDPVDYELDELEAEIARELED